MIGSAIDKVMDWTVVPGYSRLGYSVRRRLWSGPDAALSGWSVLVTGANAGIGAAACERFARAGADVHMLVRDRERGEDARARISEQTGSDRLQLEVCDVSSLESVREFAADFLRPRERAPRARQQRRRDAARADADRATGSS